MCCSGADEEIGVESKLDASVDGAVSVMSMSHHGFRGTFKDKKRLAAMVYVSNLLSANLFVSGKMRRYTDTCSFLYFLTSVNDLVVTAGNDGVQAEHKCGIAKHHQCIHVAILGEILFSTTNANW